MLINFSASYQLFQHYENLRGMEICMMNIAEIHFKNQRLSEAEEAFKRAIDLAHKMKASMGNVYENLVKSLM